ncbi:MAG: hypothetical protein HN617_07595 [Planctomycetaceae bacterium]|jgi:hypothetical protein|nr:hypothetical protein [Planctomycetaceae bacterium]MBT4011890.1 hypothetical protein [Planctomycetaceae bacterium]MBT4726685.1 hypothetical protein [Planctomycetaceae bacterium]MBT4846735.1 hypothetical protein [Planctomycetaceae bacterium]MBT5123747.1 hypothetical protein [Planctomycetaceae bacterium]
MKPFINKLIAIATLTTIVSITGCNNQAVETNVPTETKPAASVDPAASIKNIKSNVQGTLDQIKSRDQGLQDLANGVDEK